MSSTESWQIKYHTSIYINWQWLANAVLPQHTEINKEGYIMGEDTQINITEHSQKKIQEVKAGLSG